MSDNFLQEVIISLILIILLILFLNPFNFWMPSALLMMMVVGLVVVFAIFASFVWKENSRDEREGLHKMISGRVAFITGSGSIVLGIIVQSFAHQLDPWLVFILGVMVLAKVGGLIYTKTRM